MNYDIDLQVERVIPISDVSDYLPKRRGKKTHYQTVWRWVTKGANGKMLASVKIGGVRYTSIEALQRFLQSHNPKLPLGEHQDSVERALLDAGL